MLVRRGPGGRSHLRLVLKCRPLRHAVPGAAVERAAGAGFASVALPLTIPTGPMGGMNETTYAYLAGTIDADGFITISRKSMPHMRKDGSSVKYYVVNVGLSETSPVVPDLLQETFPAWRGSYQPTNPNHKRWHIWRGGTRQGA